MKQLLLALVITSVYHQAAFSQQTAMQNRSLFETEVRAMNQNNFISINAPLVLNSSPMRDAIKDSLPPKMSNTELSEQYFKKGANLQTTGFILLGIGVAATIGGYIGTVQNYDIFDNSGSGYIVLWGLGLGTAISGTVLAISGFHYKRKAKMVMQNENVSQKYHVPIKSNIVSVGIAINLN